MTFVLFVSFLLHVLLFFCRACANQQELEDNKNLCKPTRTYKTCKNLQQHTNKHTNLNRGGCLAKAPASQGQQKLPHTTHHLSPSPKSCPSASLLHLTAPRLGLKCPGSDKTRAGGPPTSPKLHSPIPQSQPAHDFYLPVGPSPLFCICLAPFTSGAGPTKIQGRGRAE